MPIGAASAKNLEFLPKNQFFAIKNYIFIKISKGWAWSVGRRAKAGLWWGAKSSKWHNWGNISPLFFNPNPMSYAELEA